MSTRISGYEHDLGKAQTVSEIENLMHVLWWDEVLTDAAKIHVVQGRLDTCVLPADYPIWDVLHGTLIALEE